jgi:hypothetical protein
MRCRRAGVRPSMGSVGDAYDNAMCESLFATLECELLLRHRFQTRHDAALAVFDHIEGFYNPRRRHTSLGNLSPANYEKAMLGCGIKTQTANRPPKRGRSSWVRGATSLMRARAERRRTRVGPR